MDEKVQHHRRGFEMKKRQIYYSRKSGGIVIEGRRGKKTIFLFSLPEPMKLLTRLDPVYLGNPKFTKQSLFFTKEKYAKIMEKIQSLNIIDKKEGKTT